MGEIMFNYSVDNSQLKHETLFKYWYDMSQEQSFAYQRFVALSDASTFNKPVAITKVATGFIDLHQLFVIQDGHSMIIQKQTQITTRSSMEPQVSDNVFGENIDEFSHPLPDKFYSRPGLIANHQEILFGKYRKGFRIDNSGIGLWYDDRITNIGYNNQFAEKSWEFTPWLDVLMGDRGRITINDNYQEMMFGRYMPYSNKWSDLFGSRYLIISNVIQQLHSKKLGIPNITNALPTVFTKKIESDVNFYENIYTITYGKISNINDTLIASKEYINVNKYETLNTLKPEYDTYYLGFENVYFPQRNVYDFKVRNVYKEDPNVNYNPAINPYKEQPNSNINDTILTHKEQPKVNAIKTLPLFYSFPKTNVIPELLVYTYGKTVAHLSLDPFAITYNKILNITDNILGNGELKELNEFPVINTIGEYKTIRNFNQDLFGVIDRKQFNINSIVNAFIDRKSADFIPHQIIAKTGKKNTKTLGDNVLFGFKDNLGMNIYEDWFITKDRLGLFIEETDNFINKDRNRLSAIQNSNISNIWIRKELSEIIADSYGEWIFKDSFSLADLLNDVMIYKETYPISIQDSSTSTDVIAKYTNVFQQGVDAIKKYVIAEVDDNIDTLIKNALDVDFSNAGSYRGLIIPISKVKKQAFIDRIDNMVNKFVSPVFITNNCFASVIPKPIDVLNTNLFCDKEAHKTYLEYRNIFITKNKVRTVMTKNEFIYKLPKDVYLYNDTSGSLIGAEKEPPKAWDKKEIVVPNLVGLTKEPKCIGTVYGFIGGLKLPHDIYVHYDEFVKKELYICCYSYGELAEKTKVNTIMQEQEHAYKMHRDTLVMDLTSAIRPIREFFVSHVCHASITREGGLYKQIEGISRTYYELKILPNDFGNWAWVYEDPDPIAKTYNIDELLLPERDTRYEDFKDIIFDKNKLRPKNPVKKIDDTTFIAKYPTKHPIPNYNGVGVVYLDVRAEIMHKIFLKFYRIWQSKLFEFSTMTMVQSVTKMLDYMYSWIMLYFPQEQIEEALRVFRQMRWYGEMAIIQNSQYIISYEYEDLKSKLNKGTCAIPNDIDPDINGIVNNDTMYVDAQNAVIRNNPTYIGIADAYVTFTVQIKKNTTLSFSLINTIGSVNIYIDDVLVDTVSTSKINLLYPLNYTGKPITIKIIKTKQNNLNDKFCIGNIIIANGTFKDLSIEFDPTLKAGNKPLDEIAKKMIQYANEHDDVKKAYEHILKTNIGVSEMYKRMVEYWEIHHQNKVKGKRLTIKEV